MISNSHNVSLGKKVVISITILISFIFFSLVYASDWNCYTNTNHIMDAAVSNNQLFLGTWGGMAVYNINNSASLSPSSVELQKVWTIVDKISSNDVRSLAVQSTTGDIWVGTYNDGITIIKPTSIQSINTDSGLPSNKVRRILTYHDYIYVATNQGISQFYYLSGVNFPLLLHQYNLQNTSNGLLSNDILDMCITSQGWLFCATPAGVSFAHTDSLDNDAAWHQWTSSNTPLPAEAVISLSYNNNFVVFMTKSSLLRTNSNPLNPTWRIWTKEDGDFPEDIFSCFIDQNNVIYVTYGRWNEDIMTLSREGQTLISTINIDLSITHYMQEQAGLPHASITRILKLNNTVALCSWGEGLFFYSSNQWLKLENNCIGFQTITEIRTDKNNVIWLASGNISAGMTRKGTRGISSLSDGLWQNFTVDNSPLTSDNTWSLEVDSQNNKLFGSWATGAASPSSWAAGITFYDDTNNIWRWYARLGMRNWDPINHTWSDYVAGSPQLFNATISEIYTDKYGNIFIGCSGGGIVVFDSSYNRISAFQIPNSQYQQVINIYHDGERYYFGTNNDYGIVIWDDDSIPTTNGSHWLIPPPSEFSNCIAYGFVTTINPFGEKQTWFATSRGLFMWDRSFWYKYDTDIKRRKYLNGMWNNDILYYVDEERLFGSVRTNPTCILLDPFNRIWIGSPDNGLSMYDQETERFTNYFKATSPLLTNYITCLGYEPINGKLLIGTPEGLHTLFIGVQHKTETELNPLKVFPNPFNPDIDGFVRIINSKAITMPKGNNICRIYDVSGQLVVELKENYFARFDWNGLNKHGKKCHTGIYYCVVSNNNGSSRRCKIALIR